MSTSPQGDLAKLAIFINVSISGSESLNPPYMTEENVFYYCMWMCAHMCVHAWRGKWGGQKTALWSWFSPSTFTRVLGIILHWHRTKLIHLANFTQIQIRSGSFTATNLWTTVLRVAEHSLENLPNKMESSDLWPSFPQQTGFWAICAGMVQRREYRGKGVAFQIQLANPPSGRWQVAHR